MRNASLSTLSTPAIGKLHRGKTKPVAVLLRSVMPQVHRLAKNYSKVIFIKLCCLVSIRFVLCDTFVNWEAEPKCVLPREAHTIVDINKLRDVWGTVVNFTDPTNERLIEVNEFLGIPYALRPEGDLRFQPPASVLWAVDYDDQANLSEDCLYLNIWTPLNASSSNQKTVLFWVHGGFFLSGSIRQEIYDARVIAGLGNVVVVTMNYRLEALGFWPSGRESAPGNVGLLDIAQAFNWVQSHISDFGLKPENISLAGQGAGAIAVGLLSLGHGYNRIWGRLIMRSGSPMYPFIVYPEETSLHSYNIAKWVGCANDSYHLEDHREEVENCMRSKNLFFNRMIQCFRKRMKIVRMQPYCRYYIYLKEVQKESFLEAVKRHKTYVTT
ncbi:Acetylcholinesterase-1 [Araneus ventricosus]|uniref:Acetylcholinesterase-1 n=1 Tax=Araneus ventricosus TaxID=182803 RepID=A0A4Y2JU46_ARAVE|nr:Acetylcholinesterase-1 [Araneus ventricosus]